MFRLENVFQNDDKVYIYFVSLLKSILILLIFYFSSIIKVNSLYEITNIFIFKNSDYFEFSLIFSSIFLILSTYLKNYKYYKKEFIFFLKEELLIFFVSLFSITIIFILTKTELNITLELFLILFFCILNLFFLKIVTNYLYSLLINNNVIQKNIMLVGTYKEIQHIMKNKMNKIFVFKCCIITDLDHHNKNLIKSEIKFPVFNSNEPIRSILEYHFLGQIWILNGSDLNKKDIFKKIIKFSVDTLNVNLDEIKNKKNKNLLGSKYEFDLYQKSRFYGLDFLLKILIDKILAIIFIILFSPLIIIFSLIIYLEDGFPILFIQNRTGWDGRRFKIFKLRSLKKSNFDKTLQVKKDDERLLNCGKFIRRWGIDEMPQFFNVLLGDMSIVGPKPHMVEHDIYYSGLFNQFLKRYKCNPGITGWAQVNGLRGSTLTNDKMKKRMHYDLWYLNNWTIFLDIYILFKTIYAILKYED